MLSRLVLGCDGAGLDLFESITSRGGDVTVLEPDWSRVEQLRERKITAREGDVTDPEALGALSVDPDVVLVLGKSPVQNVNAARAARSQFPDAYLVSATGVDATRENRTKLESLADQVISPGAMLLDALNHLIDDDTRSRLQGLRGTLRAMGGTLGVFTHDNPDPDAIASAVALVAIAEWFGVEAVPCYFGDITHQENRAFVNLLDFELRNVDPSEEIAFDHYALVDHSGPGINDQLSPDTSVDVVIDHHLPTGTIDAQYVDIRPQVGATSTMLVDYIRGYSIPVDSTVATGLLYGIRIDTRDFAQHVTIQDFEAAAYLLPLADTDVLHRVENPSVSPETMNIVARAIRNRRVDSAVLSSCVGSFSDRDAIAQAADRLLNMEGISVAIVYGYNEGRIVLSGRSRGVNLHLGETLRASFGDIGSAGGHGNMAGAQIPLGIFDEIDKEDRPDLADVVEQVVTDRLFRVIDPEEIEE
ncbi:MAG: DHH family phosphoesterase [Halodesulfurarchaeum sp.]